MIEQKSSLKALVNELEKRSQEFIQGLQPKSLYEPLEYFLNLGGKRIRPILAVAAYQSFGKRTNEEVLPAAIALELFHNFTLIHDDIMDNSPLRRGEVTVHERWSTNTAILSGDVLLIKAYQMLDLISEEYRLPVYKAFNRMAELVCQGQQYDMDFEDRKEVSLSEYLEMIELKTAVLLGCSMQVGGIVAGLEAEVVKKLYNAGVAAGIGFQIQDDYLDAYGDPAKFGKEIGGDIKSRKKTFLYLKALELADKNDQDTMRSLFANKDLEIVRQTLAIYDKYDIRGRVSKEADEYLTKSLNILESLNPELDYLAVFIKDLYDSRQ
ncbi:MAG: polyprenyl synthetase family protein [Flavobacteriales bacterium]|nr:polyprenyl synthetase family protein [Flavobacteriales bacterium]